MATMASPSCSMPIAPTSRSIIILNQSAKPSRKAPTSFQRSMPCASSIRPAALLTPLKVSPYGTRSQRSNSCSVDTRKISFLNERLALANRSDLSVPLILPISNKCAFALTKCATPIKTSPNPLKLTPNET